MAKTKKKHKQNYIKERSSPYSWWIRIVAIVMCALLLLGIIAIIL